MELFTLGVNQYTQADVEASAAAWTGHSTDNATGLTYQFFSNRHDYSMKTFMDQTRAWDGPDIINYILTTDPHRTTAAQFVATKLWSFLAYPSPEPAVVSAITTAFVNSNLNITELLRAIFMRDEFYSTKARQGLVRSPTEWVVATLKATGIPATTANPQWWMDDMGQQLFYPPNVAGWKGNAYWISTTAVWSRANFAGYIGWQWHQATPVPALLVDLDAKMAGAYTLSDSAAITEALTDFMIDSPSPSLVSNLTVWLHGQRVGQGAPEYAWVDYQFLNLIPLIMLSPDFQLN
jgi:uncharacterized protein (DUF1800 family)